MSYVKKIDAITAAETKIGWILIKVVYNATEDLEQISTDMDYDLKHPAIHDTEIADVYKKNRPA